MDLGRRPISPLRWLLRRIGGHWRPLSSLDLLVHRLPALFVSAADDHTACFWVASVGDGDEELCQRTVDSLIPHDVYDGVHSYLSTI